MTTYSAVPNGDIDPDSPITTGLMTLLRDNPIAIVEGASGAPRIVDAAIDAAAAIATSKLASDNGIIQAMLAPDSVGQSEIKIQGQVQAGDGVFLAVGGNYVMGHTLAHGGGGASIGTLARVTNDDTLNAEWNLSTDGGSGADCVLYYINSSPPYDMGDGEIPLFIYAVIDGAGGIDRLSISPDPVWIYNGPTDLTPSRYAQDGRVYRRVPDPDQIPNTYQASFAAGALAEYAAARKTADLIEVEITLEIKNADMDIIPHPYIGNDLTGKTVVLLDPVAPIMGDLLSLHNDPAAHLVKIFEQGFIKIGNTKLPRRGPAGLMIVSAEWKP